MFLTCECTYHWTHRIVVLLLCLVCHSVLSNGPFVELLINQKYNYVGIKHVLLKCTG